MKYPYRFLFPLPLPTILWGVAADFSCGLPGDLLQVGLTRAQAASPGAEPKAVPTDFSFMMPWFFLLLLLLCGLPAVADPKRSESRPDLPPINNLQLSMSVVQSGVPLRGTNRMNSLAVTLKKIGDCDGKVTIKACFFGKSVGTGKITLNKALTREGEAVAGAGNTYVFESKEFIYAPEKRTPSKTAKGRDKVVSAKGVLPHGSLVQVFVGGKLIATHASSQGYEAVIAEAGALKKTARAKRVR